MHNRVMLLLLLLVAAVFARCAATSDSASLSVPPAPSEPGRPDGQVLRSEIPLEMFGGFDVATLTFCRAALDGSDYFTILVDLGEAEGTMELQLPAVFGRDPEGCAVTISNPDGNAVRLVVPEFGEIQTSFLFDTVKVESDQGQGRLGVLKIVWSWLESGEMMLSLVNTMYGAKRALFFRETLDQAGPILLTLDKVKSTATGTVWRHQSD